MLDERAFARRASGLVRGLSLFDAFAVGFMNQGLTASIGLTISLGLSVFLGGNLIIACLISTALAGIGFPLVWGMLGGSMPRSGGEYIYNSRIIHPVVGIAQSFGDAAIWLLWIYVLAPLAVEPGLTTTFIYLGWSGAAGWLVSSPWVTFVIASLFNVCAFAFVVFGIRIFALVQRGFMVLGVAGAVLIGLVLTFTSRSAFERNWNVAAAAGHSPDYHAFIARVGEAAGSTIPSTWSWTPTLGVMVLMSWLFAYAYSISFVAGEIKRPDRTILWANLLAVLVPAAFMLWIAAALYRTVGFQFLSAAAWWDQSVTNDTLSPDQLAKVGFSMPYGSNFIDLAVYTIGTAGFWTRLAAALMGLSYVAFTFWWLALSYLAFPRILFAWGMDRMGPKWFTEINPRFASPVKNHLLCLVLGEMLLALYYGWLTDQSQNVIITGMQVTSVFIPTAVAALLLPYSKRAKGVWEASPYREWTFLGLPVIVWGAAVNLVYLGLLLYVFVVDNAARQFTNLSVAMFVGLWALGIAWYFFWKRRGRTVGVNVSVTYGALPPE